MLFSKKALISGLLAAVLLTGSSGLLTAQATKLPDPVTTYIKGQDANATIRFDGVITLSNGEVYLPVFPQDPTLPKLPSASPTEILANRPDLVTFDNGFYLIRVVRTSSGKLALAKVDPYPIRLKEGLLPQDLILPDALYIPNELKVILGDLPYQTDALNEPSKKTTTPPQTTAPNLSNESSALYVAQPMAAMVTVLDAVPVVKPTPAPVTTPLTTTTVTTTKTTTKTVNPPLVTTATSTPALPKPTVVAAIDVPAAALKAPTITPLLTETTALLYVADKTNYQIRPYRVHFQQSPPLMEPLEPIALGCLPLTVHQDSKGHLLVPCVNRPEIVTIDPLTSGVTNRIRLSHPIRETLLIAEANRLIVSHRGQDSTQASLSIIDLETRQALANVPIPSLGGAMAWDGDSQTVWVANPTQANIYGVSLAQGPDSSTSPRTLTGLANMSALVVEHSAIAAKNEMDKPQILNRLWVASRTLNQVVALQLSDGTLLKTIAVGQKPVALLMAPAQSGVKPYQSLANAYDTPTDIAPSIEAASGMDPHLWVLSAGDSRLQAVNTLTGEVTSLAALPEGSFPIGLSLSPELASITAAPAPAAIIPAGQDGLLFWNPLNGLLFPAPDMNSRIGGALWSNILPTSPTVAKQ
ncbi:MAG: hypothetical protein QE263_06210 [Vampirovibrionales bacterium]|nr:hypothetical protein [Vampirovibrionales bacterium]